MDEIFDKLFQEFADLNERFDALEEVLTNENLIKRYSVQDIADNTPLGTQTIRARIMDGTIKAQRLGNKYLITAKEFNRVCKEAKSLKYKRK
jgi:hypothetical protein